MLFTPITHRHQITFFTPLGREFHYIASLFSEQSQQSQTIAIKEACEALGLPRKYITNIKPIH